MAVFRFPSFCFVVDSTEFGGSCGFIGSIASCRDLKCLVGLKSIRKYAFKFFFRIIGDWWMWRPDFMASRHIRPVKEHEIIYVDQTWRPLALLSGNVRSCCNFLMVIGQNFSLSGYQFYYSNLILGEGIQTHTPFPRKIFLDRFANFMIFWLYDKRSTKSLPLLRFAWSYNVLFVLNIVSAFPNALKKAVFSCDGKMYSLKTSWEWTLKINNRYINRARFVI